MSIMLALHDAANNCTRQGATCVLTLRSGKEFVGELEKPATPHAETAHIKPVVGGGWATIVIAEIAAVESRR